MSDASGNYMGVIETLQARIAKLEAALQRIADAPPYSLGDIINIARKALESDE